MNAATRYNIPVSNTPDVLSKATAEIAFLLMLCVARKAFYQYQKIVNGQWQQFEPVADLGIDLHQSEFSALAISDLKWPGNAGMLMVCR